MKTPSVLPACPRCGSTRAIPITYGYPSVEGREAQRRGEVAWGGCMVGNESPQFICGQCEAPLPWSGDQADHD